MLALLLSLTRNSLIYCTGLPIAADLYSATNVAMLLRESCSEMRGGLPSKMASAMSSTSP